MSARIQNARNSSDFSPTQVLWTGFLVLALGLCSPPLNADDIDRADLTDVSAQTTVSYSGSFHNRRRRTTTVNLTVEHSSGGSIGGPLIAVIEGISDPGVTLSNGDGLTTPDGKPLLDLSGQVAGDSLDVGETTERRPLRFSNPLLRPFTIDVKTYRQTVGGGAPTISLEVPTDSQGRPLVGIPDGTDLTVRASGTSPVTVNLGQTPTGSGSRGQIFFGDSGTATTTTVTTSGGANNTAVVPIRGVQGFPSAYHGDLGIVATGGGTAQTTITVVELTVQPDAVSIVRDEPVTITVNTRPATAGVDIILGHFVVTQGQPGQETESPTNAVVVTPADGASDIVTGDNGTAQFDLQAGAGIDGWHKMVVEVGDGTSGTSTAALNEFGDTSKSCGCDCDCAQAATAKAQHSGGKSVDLSNGEKYLTETDLGIAGRGLDYRFSRSYRSQASHLRNIANDDFGVDWAASYIDDFLLADEENIIVFRSGLRSDIFIATATPGVWVAPIEYYEALTRKPNGDFELRDADGLVKTYKSLDDPDIPGRLIAMQDANDNLMSFLYTQPAGLAKQVLTQVVDPMGRVIQYRYYTAADAIAGRLGRPGRLKEVEDFRRDNSASGRFIRFDYDDEANLISVTGPVVSGTPNGNDFPQGKTYIYHYTVEADIPGSITGSDRERLLHNLIAIEYPNETAVTLDPANPQTLPTAPGTRREQLVYGQDPANPDAFDRVLSYTIGGQNGNGVGAGGTISYAYTQLATLSANPNQPYLRILATDRRGNQSEYIASAWGTIIQRDDLTRGFRTGEPPGYLTRYQYNIDKELTQTTLPEGNISRSIFDTGNPSRFAHGNVIRSERIPDARGGDQTLIATETVYEPIYQTPVFSTDPRGLDPAFSPPIPDPSGRSQRERYTGHNFFDYQEADAALVLPLLAAEIGTSEAEVQALLDASGVMLGLGDLNENGVELFIAGNVVRQEAPPVILLPGSHQAGIEGDQLQEIEALYRYNAFGQLISGTDPERNVDVRNFFPETDPDGDGSLTPVPPPDSCGLLPTPCRAALDPSTGGYLAEAIRDTALDPLRDNKTNPPLTVIHTAFERDDVGNRTGVTNGRGIRTDFFINELDQVIQILRAADIGGAATADPPDPLFGDPDPQKALTAFGYVETLFYDFNDNITRREVEDRGDTSDTGGVVDFSTRFDILDNPVTETQEVDVSETLTSEIRYDPNENPVLQVHPVGNAVTTLFDERDLVFQATRGALTPLPETLDPPPPPYDPPERLDGESSTMSYLYDLNENPVTTVDAEDTDGSAANNIVIPPDAGLGVTGVTGDRNDTEFDGLDRPVGSIDAIGNTLDIELDPASNQVRITQRGPVGGPSPGDQNGVANVDLVITLSNYDELNRVFQTDLDLFVAPGTGLERPDNIVDGPLTPGDGRVTARTEYDKKSRETFTIDDDEDLTRMDYDGADRAVKVIDPEGNIEQYVYDDNDNLIEQQETDIDQGGGPDEMFLTTYLYDSLDRLQRSSDNIGQTQFYRYDSRDNQVAMADAQGPLSGETVTRTFPPAPGTVDTINDFGNVTRYCYDGIDRRVIDERILTVDNAGDGVRIGATLEGIKTTPPTPDPDKDAGDNGRILVATDFDANSLMLSLTDDNGNRTAYRFDNLDRQVKETKGETGAVNVSCLDAPVTISVLADRIDPPTMIDTEYDRDDNIVRVDDENGSLTSCDFDGINRRTECDIQRAGNEAPRKVPGANFPTVVGTTETRFEFDGLSRMTRATDNNGASVDDDSTITYAYDSLSRVIEETQTLGGLPLKAISSAWQANNHRVGLTYPDGRDLVFTFDDLDRLNTVADSGAPDPIADYGFIGTFRANSRAFPINNTVRTETFDALRRVASLDHRRTGDNSLIVGFEHGYDRMNNKLFENKLHDPGNGVPGNSELYDYDSIYRLIHFGRGTLNVAMDTIIDPTLTMDTTTGEGVIQFQDWMLDGLGNWAMQDQTRKAVLEPENREHTNFNEIFEIDPNKAALPPPNGRVHDDNGNLVYDEELGYRWDAMNRLVEVCRLNPANPPGADGIIGTDDDCAAPALAIATYVYDTINRRVRKDVQNSDTLDGQTRFYYDDWQVLEERDDADVMERQFVYGVYIDEPLVMDSAGVRVFYHQNTLSSTFGLTDDSVGAKLVEGYLYDAYGVGAVYDGGPNGLVDWGVDDSVEIGGKSFFSNPYVFVGRRRDGESKLHWFRNRYYLDAIGRFVSRDLMGFDGGNENLYLYVFSNPVNMTDPTGFIPLRKEMECPTPPAECKNQKCFWEQTAAKTNGGVKVSWKKGVEVVGSTKICCQVGRGWGGGHIKVWLKGKKNPCKIPPFTSDQLKKCGVTLSFAPGSGPRPNATDSVGFSVSPPKGKTLEKVEYKFTLNISCSCPTGKTTKEAWSDTLTWPVPTKGAGGAGENPGAVKPETERPYNPQWNHVGEELVDE